MSRVGVEDLVHLLERFTPVQIIISIPTYTSFFVQNLLGLRAEEPNIDTGKEGTGSEEEESAKLDVLKHGWGDKANNKVAQPVGASRDRDTLGSAT